jgi:HK97 family phage prohead protease
MTLQLYWPIAKIDSDERLVYGYASTEAKDSQGEIVRKEALEAALPAYMRFANIREMHQPSAVGIAKEATIDENGLWLKAKIVDEAAWQKVKEGVYKGFSIGGAITARDTANPQVITGVELVEISLVDRPANPEAVLAVWKCETATLAKSEADGDEASPIQSLHDHAVALGAQCASGDTSAKLAGAAMQKLLARHDALEERLGAALPLLLAVKELVEKIAAQPAVTPPSRLVAIDKGSDVARELERIAEQPPALTALELIKRAVREPLPFGAALDR